MRLALILALLLLVTSTYARNGDNNCSEGNGFRKINGDSVEDYGTVASPLRGWVGYTNTGDPIPNMIIECFSDDGRVRLASAKTNASGRFVFPTVKPGQYYLVGRAQNVSTVRIAVRVSKTSNAIACVVAEADANSK